MAEETQQTIITKEPVSVDPDLIIQPSISVKEPIAPEEEIIVGLVPIPEPEPFVPFVPSPTPFSPFEPFIPTEFKPVKAPFIPERSIIINIETTGLLPFKSKIFSIGYVDLSQKVPLPVVLIDADEERLINTFMDFFNANNFTQIIGWNVSFDYRFLFGVSALYRRPIKKFVDAGLRDVQQIYQQVKEAYVYGFQKPNKLDEWGKFLLGKGKLAPQKEVLKAFVDGNFDFIEAFQLRQLDVTKGLLDLANFISTQSPETQIQSIPVFEAPPNPTQSVGNPHNPSQKKCSNCLQENPMDLTECLVCGDKL